MKKTEEHAPTRADAARPQVPSILSTVFLTPQNVLFVGAALVASVVEQSFFPLALGFGAWVAGALGWSLSLRQRRYLDWMRRVEAKRGVLARRHHQLALLDAEARQRYLEIEQVRDDVRRLSTQNPGLAASMMDRELQEFDALVDLFLKLSADEARYRAYAEETDLAELDRAIAVQTTVVEGRGERGGQDARISEEHLATLQARRDRAGVLREKLRATRAQINLLDETLRYLRDQVVTMGSEEELAGRLSALKSSLNAVEQSALETEQVLIGASAAPSFATTASSTPLRASRTARPSLATTRLKDG
ncbi:MAG: hypothetical protein IPK13_20390 [Deltaproteobacteria bacterium]|nr:hypothetical protein [Deltaproteobacteria bacterium]